MKAAWVDANQVEKLRMAYHEAGHAVANEWAGIRVEWIGPSALNGQNAVKTQTQPIDVLGSLGHENAAAQLTVLLATYLAGRLAETEWTRRQHRRARRQMDRIFINKVVTDTWKDDNDGILKIRERVSDDKQFAYLRDDEQFTRLRDEAGGLAAGLVQAAWPQIESVAEEIVRRFPRRVEGIVVRELIQRLEDKGVNTAD